MPVKTYPITLTKAHMLTDGVKHFFFSFDEKRLADFIPGQFITMHFELNGKMLRRSYSIANREKHAPVIEFAAGFIPGGPASELLFKLKEGDVVNINGPFGRLVLKDEPVSRYLLVATSTGVTPYRSMLSTLLKKMQQNESLRIEILQGVQCKKDLLYGNEFLDFANSHQNAQFHACYSREQNDNLEQHEHTGYVQSTLKQLAPNPLNDVVYLCGNPAMIDETFAYLKTLNFDIRSIRREKYISS